MLVRAGGIIVLGGECTNSIHDGTTSRTIHLFPAPMPAHTSSSSRTTGTFTLIEDDGVSNDHTNDGHYTEIMISFKVFRLPVDGCDIDVVEVDYEFKHRGYELPYDLMEVKLPDGNTSRIIAAEGKEMRAGRLVVGR